MLEITLLTILVVLQLADWFTTAKIIKNGGRELNPIIKLAMDKLGIHTALALKTLLVILLGTFLLTSVYVLLVVVGVYTGVVVWNSYQLYKQHLG